MSEILWQPSAVRKNNSQMMHFISYVNKSYHLQISNYSELHKWSLKNKEFFWNSVWNFTAVAASQPANVIFAPGATMANAKWFLGAKLNFAENLLRHRDDKLALIFNNENNQRRTYTYAKLFDSVAKVASYFRKIGLQKGDRVACVLPNMPEAIIAMLATTTIGAIWSSCSPEFGNESLFDRFHQIQPKILIISDGYFYNGKVFSNKEKINWLRKNITSLEQIILVSYCNEKLTINAIDFNDMLLDPNFSIRFEQLPFDHPVYIMYSSGTTGIPKCIVHGAGGTLLQHLKDLILHTDLTIEDRSFYYTTCSWMMWNWYISGLATGATIIQYDGAPFYPTPTRLIDLIDEELITIFGTSAKYISAIEKHGLTPKKSHSLNSLRTILSTGSPLVAKNFDYVYGEFKSDVSLSSISGGTDIISCFALGNPLLPVYRGELQCIGLGMNVQIFNEAGQSVINEKGELVCTSPFPCMPVYFWNDPYKEKYQQAYFNKFPGVWAQGDFAEITDHETMIIYGRSDATLNPGGVRIGTAEIYRQVEKKREIVEALAVGQEWGDDTRIILFVVLQENTQLTEELKAEIKALIKKHCSPRHVPAKIIAVPDVPRTFSGKIAELAVRDIIHGREVKNIASLANPECLEYFKIGE